MGYTRTVKEGHWLVPSNVAVVLEGVVAVTRRHTEGREVLMSFRGRGGLIGEDQALDGQAGQPDTTKPAYAWAVTPVRVVYIDPLQFRRFMLEYPPAWRAMTEELADRLEEAEERVVEAACESAVERLARLLVTMPTARQDDDGHVTVCGLSVADMAAWVGVARETIERRLQIWRAQGVIRTDGKWRKVTLTDLPKLAHLGKVFSVTNRPIGNSRPVSGGSPVLGSAEQGL